MKCFTFSLLSPFPKFTTKRAIWKTWIVDFVVAFFLNFLKSSMYELWCKLVSIRFKCIDLDANGVLTRNELQFFYEEQLHRMECMAQEPVLFEDILCQIIDMIGPEVCLFIFDWLFDHMACPKLISFILCRVWYLTFSNFILKFFARQDDSYVTLRDLKGSKLSGSVFNILFNLNKFMAFETRDPFLIRQVHTMFVNYYFVKYGWPLLVTFVVIGTIVLFE